jgi:hypothetical protein
MLAVSKRVVLPEVGDLDLRPLCYYCCCLNYSGISNIIVGCCRECQVKHWPKHKSVCDMLVESLNKLKVMDTVQQTQTSS